MFDRLKEMLGGKKTYIAGIALCLLALLWNLDMYGDGELTWITEGQYRAAEVFLLGIGGLAMRAGIKKGERRNYTPR